MYSYDYPHPAYAVDIAIFDKVHSERTNVLLIKRKNDPYKNHWALPGGFVEPNETGKQAAVRELNEETGLIVTEPFLHSVSIYDNPNRDPRGWTISQLFTMQLPLYDFDQLKAGDDAAELKWFLVDKLPRLAFDHEDMINKALCLWVD